MVDVERRGWRWQGEARAVEQGGQRGMKQEDTKGLLMQYLNIIGKQKPWCEEGVS